MAFLIPDDLKSKAIVPPSIRRVAEAFQIGLEENVTVWYEPLYDTKGNKPHLVILLPERGIAVLEVLGLSSSNLLGVFRHKIRLEKNGREREVENPLKRAEELASVLRTRMANQAELNGLTLSVVAMAALPDVSRAEAKQKEIGTLIDSNLCFFKEEIDAALEGCGEAQLLKLFSRVLGAPRAAFHPEQEKVLRAIIQPDVIIGNIKMSAQVEQLKLFNAHIGGDDHFRVLDRRQEAMAKSFGDGHRIVRGVAGSGKTLLLVYRAKLLARASPRKQYLLTCFTRALAGQLRETLKDYHNVDVQHLDGLMSDIVD